MKTALALLVIALATTARAEPYRPLPRLPPSKVQSRAAQGKNGIPLPPAASPGEAPRESRLAPHEGVAPAGAPGAEPPAQPSRGSVAAGAGTDAEPVARRAPQRRVRRVGPPPPLQDELGRLVVFASTPPLQDEAGGSLEDLGPVHVIVLPSRGPERNGAGRGPAARRR